MDAKNDDSAGSDSLDKSLQKKCVVDDVGQGEGAPAGAAAQQSSSDSGEKKKAELEPEGRPANSTKKQKTEKSVGDGVGGGGGGGPCVGGGVDSSSTESATKTKTEQLADGSLAAAVEAAASSVATSSTATTSNTATTTPTNSSNSNNNAFESKVKQISKNLKETTLAECAHKKASLEDTGSTSSSASSTSSTPESEQPISAAGAVSSCSLHASTSEAAVAAEAAETLVASGATSDLDTSQLAAGESTDEHDHRSKKVRFHPDVKENDGGNRVIPKKKKKFKATHAGGSGSTGGVGEEAASCSQRAAGAEDDMELDEEEELEEEEEFDLAKTIAEAQDYLKAHPLTFVRPYDKSSGRLQNGLLEEEDLPQLSESSEDEDIYEQVPPENGVERILGKQIKCGKVEFLLRYADRPGLSWESEEFICKHCPNLLNKYEENRERRQERLMRHVARRQNIRQRYTDF